MHRTRPLRALLLCLATLSVAGCGGSDQGGARRRALTSDFNADSLPLLTLVEEVRIGSGSSHPTAPCCDVSADPVTVRASSRAPSEPLLLVKETLTSGP